MTDFGGSCAHLDEFHERMQGNTTRASIRDRPVEANPQWHGKRPAGPQMAGMASASPGPSSTGLAGCKPDLAGI
jgi:hypothetical protein